MKCKNCGRKITKIKGEEGYHASGLTFVPDKKHEWA